MHLCKNWCTVDPLWIANSTETRVNSDSAIFFLYFVVNPLPLSAFPRSQVLGKLVGPVLSLCPNGLYYSILKTLRGSPLMKGEEQWL